MKTEENMRQVDDLGQVVISKGIRRTLHIREGDPSQTTWTNSEKFCFALLELSKRTGG